MKIDKRLGMLLKNRRVYLDKSQQEVADYVGVSKSTVSRWEKGDIAGMGVGKVHSLAEVLELSPMDLVNLDKPAKLERLPNKSNTVAIPILGAIAAGRPILAQEHIEGHFNLDNTIKADFALRVKGDSMKKVGIFDGDLVFLRQQCTLENGEIGAVLVEDEGTLKRFYRQAGTVVLQAENDSYEPIILTNGSVKILGKLVAVLKLHK